MTKQHKLFILFRCCLLAGIVLLAGMNQPLFITVSLAAGLFYAASVCAEELKKINPYGGYANWLTFLRGVSLTALLFFFSNLSNTTIAAAGFLLTLADVADGWLARRLQSETKMGGYLDEEMDAFYIVCIGYIAYTKQLCGFYILLPAFSKYVKDIVAILFAGNFCKPIKMPAAKWIAGISFVVYLTPFVLAENIYPLLVKVSSAALCVSFIAEMILRYGRLTKNQ